MGIGPPLSAGQRTNEERNLYSLSSWNGVRKEVEEGEGKRGKEFTEPRMASSSLPGENPPIRRRMRERSHYAVEIASYL